MASPTRFTRSNFKESFRAAADEIQQAVNRGLRDVKAGNYDRVAVLIMRWSNDDIGVQPLEKELSECLRRKYGFWVENVVINGNPAPGTPIQTQLNNELMRFVLDNAVPNSLCIYVYSGHAWNGHRGEQSLWYGNENARPRRYLDWNQDSRAIVDSSGQDTLYLFDCCYATTTVIDGKESEYLVAASMENIASIHLHISFTRRLIDILVDADGAALNIVTIHALMVKGMTAAGTAMDYTPVHVGANSKPSIVLKRLAGDPSRDAQYHRRLNTSSAGKVLVSLSLEGYGSVPNAMEFQKWLLTNVPANLASVKVEAVFDKDSQLILLTLPIEVWDCLDIKAGFKFVDYVKSHNLLLEPPGLSERPRQRGGENSPSINHRDRVPSPLAERVRE